MFDKIKDYMYKLIRSRLFIVAVVFLLLSLILINRVFYLQIVKGQNYSDNYKLQVKKTRDVQGTRGRILDRNGVVLADNELSYAVTLEDNGSYDTTADKNKSMNTVANKIIQIVESHGDSVINDFGVILNSSGEYQYTKEGTQLLRFLADIFGYKTIDMLSVKQKSYTAEQLITLLCTDPKIGFGIEQKKYDKAHVLKIINIRYAVNLNKFQKYISATIAHNVSAETVAQIMENLDALQGASVQETYLRNYLNGQYFSSIIGYTGQISQEEYDKLNEENSQYSLQDVIGKAGLEQTLDKTLQGKKGQETVYVDSLGKVIESEKLEEPTAGNDIYLTLDSELQAAAYQIVEEKLAGILLAKIQNTLNYTPDPNGDADSIIIPISDVYNTFIDNEIIDTRRFLSEDAKVMEKQVYSKYVTRSETVVADIIGQLNNAESQPYKQLNREMQAYMNYIATEVLTSKTGILIKDSVDKNDQVYKQWTEEESISLYTYLNYAISKNWIDTAKLSDYVSQEKYSDSLQIYQGIVKYLSEYLKNDKGLEKIIYRYMIRSGGVSGNELCMILYEQNILEFDESSYNNLAAGSSAYDFVREKIRTLALTPGQLALEPCTASVTITEPGTGDVLAMVSYPGYDNNRLSNNMDSSYYNKLIVDKARPLFNTATQEKTAPGSTYKMVSTIAGLTEGVINEGTVLPCTGIYDKVSPNPKCWIHPGAHGGLNVVNALSNSCNNFYYEVGYRLGTSEKAESNEIVYQSDLGIDVESKYASMLGLDEKSGVEIEETDPEISDSDSVRSSIGQGTNNYTTSQLARYVSAIANGGTLNKLTLLNRAVDVDGNLVTDYTKERDASAQALTQISSNTIRSVQEGMRLMVSNSRTFSSLRSENMTMSGKTGTAEQSAVHPNHALFVGYAPSVNPEIAMSVRITNGYNSNYTSEIARDVVRYHFNLTDKSNLITGQAASLGIATRSD